MRFLIYSAYLGLVLLIVATVGLVIMNWGEKLYAPLMSLFFVGTLTTFITVFVMLKEAREETVLTTSIVFDEEEHLPLFIIPQETNFRLTSRLNELSLLGRPIIGQGDNLPLTVEKPNNFDETATFGGELLQYKIVTDIRDMQRGSTSIAHIVGVGTNGSVQTPYTPPDMVKIEGAEALSLVATNRFSNSTMEKFRWEHGYLLLPEKTQLKLSHISSSEKTGVEKHIVALEKPYFFTIEIIVEPFVGTGLGSLPVGVEVPPDKARRCQTYLFKVTMKAKFEKYTAGNWRTDEYKNWVKWMFSELRERLADG